MLFKSKKGEKCGPSHSTSGAVRLKDCNDGIENHWSIVLTEWCSSVKGLYLISCHFSKEGLEEYELGDFALIIRDGLKIQA